MIFLYISSDTSDKEINTDRRKLIHGVANMMDEKTIQELALLELTKNARILQRQLKLMKGMSLGKKQREIVREIITSLEKEFNLFKI